jgi:hypothetical protein
LAGHAFGVDREVLAAAMAFEGPTLNSIDSVCDRDFIAEFLSMASLMMVHISQFAEDVILLNWRKAVALAGTYPFVGLFRFQLLQLLKTASNRCVFNWLVIDASKEEP